VAFVADANRLIVLDVLLPVTLGMDEDLFFILFVFDAQFVEAFTAGAAEFLEDAAGLVARQVIGDLMFLVIQAVGDHWQIWIAFEEGDQHFHTNAWNRDTAIAVAGPAACDAYPAAGLVVGLAVAVPVELNLDTAVLIAMDF